MFSPLAFEQTTIITNGLVLNLDASDRTSYPGTGTAWNNISTGINNGTLTNGPTFNSGNGGYISFDGVDDFVEFGDVLDLGTNSMTVNSWVYTPSYATQIIFSKAYAGPGNYRYAAGIANNNASTAFVYGFMQGNGGDDVIPWGSGQSIQINTWFMATYVFERSSNISLYINGSLIFSNRTSTISQWNGLNFQSSYPTRVAAYTAGNGTGIIAPWNGRIGQFSLYFRALTQAEISQNFQATRARFGI